MASWPSVNASASTSTVSPTTRLMGNRPPSTSGLTLSMTTRRRPASSFSILDLPVRPRADRLPAPGRGVAGEGRFIRGGAGVPNSPSSPPDGDHHQEPCQPTESAGEGQTGGKAHPGQAEQQQSQSQKKRESIGADRHLLRETSSLEPESPMSPEGTHDGGKKQAHDPPRPRTNGAQ